MTEDQRALSPWRKIEEIVRRAILRISPNFGKFDKIYFARIEKVNFDGGLVDDRQKGFSVDVQPLQKDLSDDTNFEKIIDVPIDSNLFNNNGAVYHVPNAGSIVRLAFMYNDPSFPFVVSISNEGATLPKGVQGEFRIDDGKGTIFQIASGKINFKTKKGRNSDLDTLIDIALSHTHLGNMGAPTSAVTGSIPPITELDFKTGTL